MSENTDKALDKLLEKRKAIDEQIKRKKAIQSDKERKARTRRLIELGAVVESVLGRPILQEEIPRVKEFLLSQEKRGQFFSTALKKEEVKNEL